VNETHWYSYRFGSCIFPGNRGRVAAGRQLLANTRPGGKVSLNLTHTTGRRESEPVRISAYRHAAGVGMAAVALITVGCSNGKSVDATQPPQAGVSVTSTAKTPAQPTEVKLIGEGDVEVTLTGPIAAKYSSATENQRQALGKPLTGDRNAGKRESGLVFQQFEGGVITAKNDQAGTSAYITTGKIREAWNIPRDPDGTPAATGTNGSAGPLGYPISDVNAVGDLLVSNFEHGRIEYNPTTGQVQVTVNGKVVPSGL
jgi:hypothetical protein